MVLYRKWDGGIGDVEVAGFGMIDMLGGTGKF